MPVSLNDFFLFLQVGKIPVLINQVQVPPGHVMQQIVDENGTLRHVILSTQHQQIQGGVQGVQHHIHGHYVSTAFQYDTANTFETLQENLSNRKNTKK